MFRQGHRLAAGEEYRMDSFALAMPAAMAAAMRPAASMAATGMRTAAMPATTMPATTAANVSIRATHACMPTATSAD